MPVVTVIIPNYNHAPYLRERINSVLNQTFEDFELILLDDASTDESRAIIESFRSHPKVKKILVNEKNSGSPFSQWQKGLEFAEGDWTWIAESDDKADEKFLETLIGLARLNEKAAIIYCDSVNRSEQRADARFSRLKNLKFNVDRWNEAYTQDGKAEIDQYLKWECTINNASAVLVLTGSALAVIKEINHFQYHGDWLFYLQIATRGNVVYTPAPLNTYLEHDTSPARANGFYRHTKIEHFRILSHLLSQEFISDKKQLVDHFCSHYIGLSLLKGWSRGDWKIFLSYLSIDASLALKSARVMLSKRFKFRS